MDFSFNADAARNSERAGEYISESGAYVGVFLRASEVTSSQNTQGIDLLFESKDRQRADYITLWHTKSDGIKLPGYDAINALMACLRLRNMSPRMAEVEKWNKEQKKYIKTSAMGYPDLCHKPIGIVLQNTLSSHPTTGTEQKGKQIIGFFEASSRLTAREILDKATTPAALDKQLAWLEHNPVRDTRGNKTTQRASAPQSGSVPPDWDEDQIPF